ncbi:MAG: sigma-54-dependent Fis family transcriptional regulator [Phycisphaerales bacterium]|nr:sigma-54-dependent Fis family transcriptional regulator [Phycisphaerales bacterium]
MRTVLVVDDKEMMRDSVAGTLRRAGMEVITANDGAAALEAIAQKRPDAVITDQKMPGMGGIELLEKIRQIDDELPVVVMTAFGSIETAVRAMRLGAFDYLTKPFEGDELLITAKRAIEHAALLREHAVLRATVSASEPARTGDGAAGTSRECRRGVDRLIGSSVAMRDLRRHVAAVAGSQGTVLICGESGVGKEVVARAIHESSGRSSAAYLGVNCAALSESLLESELFGHERGAFTGAEKMRKGRFELADGGTLVLDEVSEVPAQIQAKLLRILQERAFERVGSSITIGVDVRVVATSNRDLQKSIDHGQFRQDLFFRLNVLPVHVPSLRERREDIPELAAHFVGQIARREGRGNVGFDTGAVDLLQQYHWPGNVRELQNICERAVVLTAEVAGGGGAVTVGAEVIEPWLRTGSLSGTFPGSNGTSAFHGTSNGSLPEIKSLHGPVNGLNNGLTNGVGNGAANGIANGVHASHRTLEEIERDAIVQTLVRHNGHRQRTASALGIGVRTLGLKLKRWKELHLVESNL